MSSRTNSVERQAARIVDDVRRRGDAAIRDWQRRLGDPVGPLTVSRRELERGWDATPPAVRRALRDAARQIRRVATAQRPRGTRVEPSPGVLIEQRVQPFARVGCYVPGGRYPLPSSLLMTAVTARVAGVETVVAACPSPAPAVCAAALEADVDVLYQVGGAQAIAALAYGTRSVMRVDKIAGPGNTWVTAAKRLVAADCAIDMDAGPSEIAIYSNTGHAAWIAADLLAQAEHDPRARTYFVTTRPALAAAVRRAIAAATPATGPAAESIASLEITIAPSPAAAIDRMNAIAAEHAVCDTAADARRLLTSGTVFVGRWSAQAAGDYMTGSNHVLPTGRAARWRGGLSAADFVRIFTVQTVTRRGIRRIAGAAIALADAEGLTAHAASIALRRQP
jgi:histidinol dehydrogenase